MRKAILDINEMSDSKEVYGERPNPFIAAFIYSLLALLVIALIYSFYGKIEIVATASGMVRPNDDISTVSSLVGGKVTSVAYTDGQVVQNGDVLLTIDTSDAQIRLNSLLSTQKEYQFQADMLTKFLNGIESGKNPFSSDTHSEEYPYYVRYRDFDLTLRNMRETSAKEREQNLSDADRTNANIQSVQKQIADMQYQINGLTKYKESIEQGKNLATDYPEYSNMYVLYKETLDALEHNYRTERDNIVSATNS